MIKKFALSISCLFILTFYPAVSQAVTCQTGYIEYNGSCYKKLACENGGTQKADACVCKNGWVGTLCQTAKACTGYDYIKCPTGYLVSSSCMSGDTKKLKCGKCATGYVKQGTKCYKKLSCQNGGTQEANTCVCKDGWEGTLCQTAKTCTGYVRTSCPTGYVVNTSCTSGNTQYVKCKVNPCTGHNWTKCPTGYAASSTCMSGSTQKLRCGKCATGYIQQGLKCYKKLACKNGGTQKANTCVCKDGWEGTLCQTAKTCTGYVRTSCPTGYVVNTSCTSGNTQYVKCKVNPCTGHNWTKCPTGYAASSTCMSGSTQKLRCGKCATGYIQQGLKCYKKLACKNGGTQKANTCVCKDGWEGTLCQTAKTCAGYDYTACPTGYAASASCMSGTVQKLKCGNCASGYIKQSGKCYKDLACKNGGTQSANKCVCKEGWIGTNCGTKATCAYNTTSCTGGYEETGNTCKSGNITYRECKAKAVPSGYTKNKCTAGYTQEATFLSGTTTYYKCTANKCDGYVKSCSAGYVPTSDTCLSATTTMYKCAVNPCTGYSAACPKDYYVVVGDTCQSGSVIMYKCKTDLTDFDNGSPIVKKELTEDDNVVTWDDGEGNQDITTVNNEDLKVVTRAENTVTGVLSTQDEVANAYADEGSKIVTVDIEQRGNGDVYGMRAELGDDVGDGLDVDNTLSAGTADVTSTIKIKNKGNGNTYGMYTNADISDPKNEGIYMSNVWADIESEGTGVIDITSQGNGDVYGMFADETSDMGKNIETINAQADEKAVGSGIIKINKIGNGDVYGMKAKSWAVNASAHGQDEIVNQSTANGVININQSGNGNVYGIYADRAINASTGGGKETSGLIRIYGSNDTAKNSNIYGIVGKTIDNAVSDDGKKASGIINIIVGNTKEHNADNDNIIKAYGMYSDVAGNRINNISEGLVSSIIEMTNIYENSKYADIIGIYSNNGTINNSGNILLHNLSYGHAYGIKADNATVYNSGDIVVDNSDFVDNMATEDEGDDVTYTVSNVDWQNNYGLYVKDSEITNSGTITVSNDKSAEGILINGGTVTNNGTINVSGNSGAIGMSSYSGETGSPTIINNGIINVSGSGDVYGIDANAGNITNNNEINVVVEGKSWNVYGMNSSSTMVSLINEGLISIDNKSDAAVSGIIGTNNGTIDITNVGDGNITGVDIWDNDVEIGQGTININNKGNGNVIGIYPAVQPYDYEQAKHSGSVFIHNKGNGKVSDGVATESEIYNKGAGSIETYALSSIVHNTGDASISTSSNNAEIYNEGNGNISISGVTQSYVENTGDGDIEIHATNSVVYNTGDGSISTSSNNEEIHNEGDGDIVVDGGENVKIDNNGDGNISGNFFVQNLIIRNVGNGDIFGATGVEYGYGAGTISTAITNTGTGSAYGFWSDANYFDSDNDIAVSLVSKGSGNAYGMYFDGLNSNNTYNINSNIKMANKVDGFAVGLYAKDSNITNTGDITIHNLGSGTAVGIFAEGTSNIVNSGNITIDRKSFLDENTFSGKSISYSASDEVGGKAVGIYGSGESTITNAERGVIRISGADKTIGIYSEGGNVYNYGTIILDDKKCAGAVCESVQNAIRLYGGKLFQEGKMVADANWDSAPNDPRGVIGTLSNVNNNNLRVENYDEERNIFGMLNENVHYVSNALIETDGQEAQIVILNRGNGHAYGVYGHYVTNADVIENSGSGAVYIDNKGNGDVYGLAGFKQNAFAGEEWGASNTDIVDKNALLRGDVSARALINITNIGSGHIYGLFAELADKEDSKIGNAQNAYGGSTAEIVIDNTNTTTTRSNVYGIYADEAVNATSFAQNEANGVIDITNIGKSDIYGVYGKKVKNAEAKNGDKAVAKGDISIYNIGVGDVIGINGSVFNSDETAHNSWVESADSAIGNINITNKYGNVYGIKGDGLVHNAEARNNGEAKGRIEISDIEGGNIYGIAADSVYNAQSGYYHGDDGNFDILSAHGVVSINSNSNGNVYGLKANSRAYNVKADDGYATGIIRVSYNGEGNAYGIWSNGRAAGDEIASYNASINNAYNSCVGSDDCSKGTAWANGQIIMINKNSGNAYAMYSAATGNMILNTNRVNFGKGVSSIISIGNVGDGLSVAMYSKNGVIENTGDIKIQNIANGTAIGLYADGNTRVINTGNITIDHRKIIDDNATPEEDDDVLYSPAEDNEVSGRAIGIYGAADSSIYNSGTIVIDGAKEAYGIYSEGGDVENIGDVVIDGKVTENSIRLNGGKLLQNGVLIAGADWNDNGQSGSYNCVNGEWNGKECVCNQGWSGVSCDEANSCPRKYTTMDCVEGYHEDPDDICWSGDTPMHVCVIDEIVNKDEVVVRTLTDKDLIVHTDAEGGKDIVAVNNEYVAAEETAANYLVGVDVPKNYAVNSMAKDGDAYYSISLTQHGTGDVYGMRHMESKEDFAPEDEGEQLNMVNANTTDSYQTTGNISVYDYSNYDNSDKNIYGMYSNAAYMDIYNVGSSDTATAKSLATGNIYIDNNSDKNVYGIYSQGIAVNAESDASGTSQANITVANYGNGNVYGIYSASGVYNAVADNGGISEAEIGISNYGRGDVYGIYGESVVNAEIKNDITASATSHIKINNTGDGSVFGINGADVSTHGIPKNANVLSGGEVSGYINIINNGNGDVYGMSVLGRTYNSEVLNRGTAIGRIDIENNGNGEVYGINSTFDTTSYWVYNARIFRSALGEITDYENVDATGVININNNSNSNVYGIKTEGKVKNSEASYGGRVTGIIRIGNQGQGDTFGIWSSAGEGPVIANAYNGYQNSETPNQVTGKVGIINNNIGNAYGLYAKTSGNIIENSSSVNNDTNMEQSTIEMANIDNGLVVGIYSKDGSIENSGDINIHNFADGTAVGIMADGTTHVENTGTITIDRDDFVDDMATEDKDDDVEYYANGKTGGKAVGIYGSADSDILNGGTIRIYGAEKAYGIYSEGGSVTNTGRILIDDTECEGDDCFSNKQAISLNGGQLFQDGLLIAGADWGNAVDNDEMLIGSTDTLNNKNIYLNNEDKRDVYGMYNVGGSIYNSSITDSTGIININNVSGNSVYGMYSGDEGRATNANNGNGIIRIGNTGDGNVYGIQSGYTQNATRNNGNETGKVIVVNNGSGNAYGLHGKKVYSETNEDRNQYSEIEMANRGDGLAVGMYGTEYVKNSGAITIHNLGNGTAIGMYGDEGAEIDNTGIITIDRSSYTDHVNIIPSRSDPTYSADTETGGKAIGIYGAADTEIDNDGIINISGTADAYGIWSEGGDVENDGVIIINGNENSANAIRLNAGILFQNGILIAEPEWSNIGDDYIDPESEENWNYIANNSDIPPIIEDMADDVVGFEGNRRTVINAFAYPKDASGSIEVTQDGSGSVYGIRGLAGDSNDEEDQEVYNAVSYGANTATGTIRVTNTGNGEGAVYGMYGSNEDMFVGNATNDEIYAQEGLQSTGTIEIVSSGNKNVYGIYSNEEAINAESDEIGTVNGTISIENTGTGDVYGLRAHDKAYNSNATEAAGATGHINISNNGSGDVYGMFSERSDIFNSAAGRDRGLGQTKDSSYTYGLVNVYNNGKGSTYGMKGVLENDWNKSIFNARASFNGEATGRVRVVNLSDGNLYGIYGTDLHNADVGGTLNREYNPSATGIINVISAEGKAYGMYGRYIYNQSDANRSSTIEMTNTGNGLAVGMYAQNGYINNSGDIIIHNLGNGKAVGIIAEGSTGVYNSGNITIDRESYYDDLGKQTYSAPDNALYGGTAIGIYGGEGTSITNSGTITINKASTAFGIWSAGGNVVNTGSISIDGSKCTGDACLSATNAIILNGGTLFQDGELRVSEIVAPGTGNNRSAPATTEEEIPTPTRSRGLASLNLNDFGGTVVASSTSQFIAEGSISGDLAINNNVIDSGFDTTYTVADMIQAGDVSGLNLISQSALFDASLENGTDAVMTMKSFNEVVNNQSLADFLKQNYDAENNETFFNMLKNHETVVALNETLNSIIGNEVFNRFNFEDMTMIRELNMDVNNTLFNNNDDNLITSGNIAPFYFDSENGAAGKYALYNRRIGKKSFGLSLAFSNVNSRDRKDNNSREDESFQMSVPFGYKAHGFKFITAPRFGYAYGHYDRDGFENTVYKGTMEKRMFGLMNEVRYPIKLGGWKIAPAAEFNMLGYHLKGGESAQAYSLNIKSQNNYSVETGLGIYANREFKPSKNSVLNFNAGVAAYHEFADPYTVELGMHDMNGSFKLRDERRKDNRAVVRTGFDYSYGDITLEGSFATFVDGITHTRAGVDLRYNF